MSRPDRAAEFEALVSRHRGALQRQALRLADGDVDLAEDMVQDALVKAWRSFATFAEGTNFGAWVSRIMYHDHVSRWRRQRPTPLFLEEAHGELDMLEIMAVEDGSWAPEMYAGELLGEEVVTGAVGMTREFWEALMLCAVCGLSYEEIGERLGIPMGTVRSRVYRGRRDLRVALTEWAREEYGIVAQGTE
jgi:RNA polymerase sigma-70 factor (ECF subfamily)